MKLRGGNYPSNVVLQGGNDVTNWILSVSMLIIALTTLLGGSDRWAGEAFAIARQVPGSPYSWGWVLLAVSTVFTVGHSAPLKWGCRVWLVAVGSILCMFWCAALAFCQGYALQANPYQISGYGIIIWLMIGAFFMVRVGQSLATLIERNVKPPSKS